MFQLVIRLTCWRSGDDGRLVPSALAGAPCGRRRGPERAREAVRRSMAKRRAEEEP